MKKLASLVLASAMAVVPFAAGLAATFTPGEYEATAQGCDRDRRKRDPGAGRRCDRGL